MAEYDEMVWILRALSLDGKSQISLFPEFVLAADELALTWETFYRKSDYLESLTAIEREPLAAIDEAITKLSGPSNLKYWSNEALSNYREWDHIRFLAKKALHVLKLKPENPGEPSAIYIKWSK